MENKTCEWASHPSNRQDPVCEEPATKCIWYRPGQLGEQRFYICEKHYKGIRKSPIPEGKTCEWTSDPFNRQQPVCEELATECICYHPNSINPARPPWCLCEKHYKEIFFSKGRSEYWTRFYAEIRGYKS